MDKETRDRLRLCCEKSRGDHNPSHWDPRWFPIKAQEGIDLLDALDELEAERDRLQKETEAMKHTAKCVAKNLKDMKGFAAPEIWELHIDRAIEDLGGEP